MNKTDINRIKLLNNLFDEVKILKESTNFSTDGFDSIFPKKKDDSSFENQNERVFNINMYILVRLFKSEIDQIREEKGKFGIEEYYDLIESLELPVSIYELYADMPSRIEQNRILSYATDIPSYMGM